MNRAVNTIAAVLRARRRCAHAAHRNDARCARPLPAVDADRAPDRIAGGISRERGDGRDQNHGGDGRLTVHDRECREGGDGGLAGDDDEKGVAEHEHEQQWQSPRACRDGGQQIVEHAS